MTHPEQGVGAVMRRPPLLAHYRDEWMTVASDGRRKGIAWARLLAAPRLQTPGAIHASA